MQKMQDLTGMNEGVDFSHHYMIGVACEKIREYTGGRKKWKENWDFRGKETLGDTV